MDALKRWTPHLQALRGHVIRVLLAWGVAAVGVFVFKERVLELVLAPVLEVSPQTHLITTGVTELFASYIRLSLWGGFILAIPVLLFEAWRFLKPALYKEERATVGAMMLAVPFMSALGAWFGWAVLLPPMIRFFLGFSAAGVSVMPHIADYISLLTLAVGLMAVAFNLPLILALLARIGLIRVQQLRRWRRVEIIVMVVIAGFIAPPEPVSQVIVIVPLCLLYELAILLADRVQR
jgi:sec-independent protein translocase protein TatC